MSNSKKESYLIALKVIESEEINNNIISSNFSKMEKKYREKIIGQLNQNALFVKRPSDDIVLSSDEAALKLMGLLNGG